MFDAQSILENSFVRHVDWRAEAGSTSDEAIALAADPRLATPALVVAERQTAGRGRGANRWWSGEGGLAFSLVLDADDAPPPERRPRTSLAVAVAICAALEEFAPRAALAVKWPNDVFADGRKLAGVLIEAPNLPRRRLIIGVGVNVNNSWRDAPPELESVGTSLADLAGRTLEVPRVLLAILREMERCVGLISADDSRLAEAWQSLCVLRGRRVTVDREGKLAAGLCQGIDREGALVLVEASGTMRIFGGVVRSVE